MTTQKQCTKCLETKPLDEYYKHRKSADGHYSHCKKCHTAKNTANRRVRWENEPDYRKYHIDYNREYREKSQYTYRAIVEPEECNRMRELYYQEGITHKEVARITGRAWRTVIKHTNGECKCNY